MKKKITFSHLFLSLELLVSFLHPTTARGGDRSSNATSGLLLLFRFDSVAFSLCSFHVFRFSMRNDLILIASITYLKLDQNVLWIINKLKKKVIAANDWRNNNHSSWKQYLPEKCVMFYCVNDFCEYLFIYLFILLYLVKYVIKNRENKEVSDNWIMN